MKASPVLCETLVDLSFGIFADGKKTCLVFKRQGQKNNVHKERPKETVKVLQGLIIVFECECECAVFWKVLCAVF